MCDLELTDEEWVESFAWAAGDFVASNPNSIEGFVMQVIALMLSQLGFLFVLFCR
jgi:hypothetical protein